MREIEIKARVANKAALLDLLADRGVSMSLPITQHDRVFEAPDPFFVHGERPWLRIRTETKDGTVSKHIFTLKKSVTNQMDSIEHETDVSDDRELERIIGHIGFIPYSDLTKTRQKGNMGDLEICVDTVEQLGDFIEVEKLTEENADYDVVAAELWSVLESLGITREEHVTDGYDVLMNALPKKR